jgi:uncharacterized repeat protein (TIGR03803 family)
MKKTFLCVVMVVLGCGLAFGQHYSVLYSFGLEPDGNLPEGPLTSDSAGNLYGTTAYGGNPGCFMNFGCGVVFELTQSGGTWTEHVLYTFSGGTDGGGPGPFTNLLLDGAGNLYGAAGEGGDLSCNPPYGCGTVFELTPVGDGSWTYSVLYAFENLAEGGGPSGVTFDSAGNLYGIGGGGTYNYGVVWQLMPNVDGSWSETTLYSFSGHRDGAVPEPLIYKDGVLYGTTQAAGSGHGCTFGCGTIFALVPSGTNWMFHTLYAFVGGNEGGNPIGPLTFDDAGHLFGAAYTGGAGKCGGGVIYMFTPSSRKYVALHAFDCNPGSHPTGGLAFDSAGHLFGTTQGSAFNDGTMFGMEHTPDGRVAYRTLHVFSGSGGYFPDSGVIPGPGGGLYGTAENGGANNHGVVYEIIP